MIDHITSRYKWLVLSILLYWCETWTPGVDAGKPIQTFEKNSWESSFGSPTGGTNNGCVRSMFRIFFWTDSNLSSPKLRIGRWNGLPTFPIIFKTITQRSVEGGRNRRQQSKSWSDNIKEWTDMTILEVLRDTVKRLFWMRVSISSVFNFAYVERQSVQHWSSVSRPSNSQVRSDQTGSDGWVIFSVWMDGRIPKDIL